MLKKNLFILVYCLGSYAAQAQKIKTEVLVTGRENWAAALQSAHSAVKTIFVYSPGSFPLGQINVNLSSGITAELLKKANGNIGAAHSDVIIQKWLDSTKNLTLIQVQQALVPTSSGSGWQLRLDDGRTIKARVSIMSKVVASSPILIDYTQNLYRTSLVSGIFWQHENSTATFLNIQDFLDPEAENAVFVAVPEIQAAQAAGAIGAYAAFFKTKTNLSNLKRIQGELLGYKSALVPLADVVPADSSWRAIQNLSLMGVLKPVFKAGKLYFNPRQEVQVEEVKQPIKDLFYKAQIWFDDNSSGAMTLAKTISLVCYVGNKSEASVRALLEKKWKTDFKNEGSLDYAKPMSRAAFSIIVNDYLKPADVTIDKTGRITR
ncbi:MAG: hypothetical protein EOO88_17815 [Pedobacter sp.]|nr:MAG: hypothetical protein EOO88_17815 [Pedobacter sp.]